MKLRCRSTDQSPCRLFGFLLEYRTHVLTEALALNRFRHLIPLLLLLVHCGAAVYGEQITPQGVVARIEQLDGQAYMHRDGRSVETVNLLGKSVRDADLRLIGTLTSVVNLHLRGTPITDKGVHYLSRMTKLENLDLHGTRITDAALPGSCTWTRWTRFSLVSHVLRAKA